MTLASVAARTRVCVPPAVVPASRRFTVALAALLIVSAWSGAGCVPPAAAGEADVKTVHSTCTTIRTCDFEVKILHADVGMSHYADRFEILTPDGEVLATRVLQHPHVHEQPFTRGVVGVEIPDGVGEVVVRARDSVHGLGGDAVKHRLEFPERGHETGGSATGAVQAPPVSVPGD